jgi:F0F1-type ATP synthase assembly protein I
VQGGLAHAVTARSVHSATETLQESTRPRTSAPAPPRHVRPEMLAPLLLGAMVGALVAGRFETGVSCLLVALVAGVLAGARPP